MDTFIKTLSSENYTISAVIVGLLLCQGMDYEKQNILGGWLMLVGQLIQTNAGFDSMKEVQKSSQDNQDSDSPSSDEQRNLYEN